MKRRPLTIEQRERNELELWFARRDAAGYWRIVNAKGEEPLRHLDPLGRLCAIHLAASAPLLRHELKHLARRLELSGFEERALRSVFAALADSRPIYTEVVRAQEQSRQGIMQLDLDEAA